MAYNRPSGAGNAGTASPEKGKSGRREVMENRDRWGIWEGKLVSSGKSGR